VIFATTVAGSDRPPSGSSAVTVKLAQPLAEPSWTKITRQFSSWACVKDDTATAGARASATKPPRVASTSKVRSLGPLSESDAERSTGLTTVEPKRATLRCRSPEIVGPSFGDVPKTKIT
jgi:hypothetical protein